MNNILKFLKIILSVYLPSIIIFYFIHSFVLMQLDCSKWSESQRIGYILWSLIFPVLYHWRNLLNKTDVVGTDEKHRLMEIEIE